MDQSQIWSVWHICNPQGHSNVKLQLAATFCITNLIWNEDDGKTAHTARILLGSLIMNVFKLCWQNVEVLKMFRRNNIHSHREGPRFTLKVHCTPRFKFIAVEFDLWLDLCYHVRGSLYGGLSLTVYGWPMRLFHLFGSCSSSCLGNKPSLKPWASNFVHVGQLSQMFLSSFKSTVQTMLNTGPERPQTQTVPWVMRCTAFSKLW